MEGNVLKLNNWAKLAIAIIVPFGTIPMIYLYAKEKLQQKEKSCQEEDPKAAKTNKPCLQNPSNETNQ